MQSAYIHLYLIIINIITFALYGLDKWRAMTRQWYFKLGIPGIFVLQIMFAIHFILKS